MDETVPSLEVAYVSLRPLLFGALGKLARQGFVVAPSDSMDLIHDFFAESWEGIVSRYDSEKGRFEAYVYVAFLYFARPRIIRLQRLNCQPLGPSDFRESGGSNVGTEADFELSPDVATLRAAISHLPELEREVLSAYIHAADHSERELAREFSTTRHKLREILVGALGRIVVLLDKPERMPERDWQVALALWRDERTVPEAASYLGLTEHQVRAAHARNNKLLAEALKYFQPPKGGRGRRPHMDTNESQSTHTSPDSPGDIVKKLLSSPGNQELLRAVRERSAELLEAFQDIESLGIPEEELEGLDPLWVADIYEAIASVEEEPPPEEAETIRALLEASANDERSVGTAYKLSLMPGLPEHLQLLENHLATLPMSDPEEIEELLETPAAQAAWPHSEGLARYGVTPLTILYATDAISSLLERLKNYEMLPRDEPVLLVANREISYDGEGATLTPEVLAKEIANIAECRDDVARVIFAWTLEVAQYKPALFAGLRAEPTEGGVRLIASADRHDNLFERWGVTVTQTPRWPAASRALAEQVAAATERQEGARAVHVPDEVLVARIRASIEDVVTDPSALTITACLGHVTLSGLVPSNEVTALLAAVESVPNVLAVSNLLQVYESGDETLAARLVMGVAGGALIAYGLGRMDALGVGAGAMGLAALVAGGLTNPKSAPAAEAMRGVEIRRGINIAAPVQNVYQFLSNYENFPRFMDSVLKVEDCGDGRCRWAVAGPAGKTFEWDAVTTERVPNEVLAWKTVDDAPITNTGTIRLDSRHGGRTRVNVHLTYGPPADAAGSDIATLFRTDHNAKVHDDLIRMKTIIETGEL